jgi:GR25 family glycosyltransferase involved in LPS biosynthesis
MTFSVAVRTIKTRPVDYFTPLALRLAAHVLPHQQVLGIHTNEGTGITPNENACRAIEKALADNARWILFFEDDAEFIDDIIGSTARWLRDYEHPRVHFYPLGCNYNLNPSLFAMNYSLESYYGTVGVAIRAEAARRYIEALRQHPDWMTVNPATGLVEKCLDLNLARWHKRAEPGQTYTYTPSPCFVNHLGTISTIATSASHFTGEYPGYAGKDFVYHGKGGQRG